MIGGNPKLGLYKILDSCYDDATLVSVVKHLNYVNLADLEKAFGRRRIDRLAHEGQIRILNMKTSRHGARSPIPSSKLFHDGYHQSAFIVSDRTGLLRLLSDALKPPVDTGHRHAVGWWLRSFLSEAETMAVEWKLGRRKWNYSERKRNIQVDGVVKPIPCRKAKP